MSAFLGADEFLLYNATYRVLICRPCQYAIQKSAVESHLLRHKIYRLERQQLLAEIAVLELLEPDDVQNPPLISAPIDGLPLIPGLRCNFTACGELFASSKRMKRHWSETHKNNSPGPSFASDATLQTFFRGTKIRYFQVDSSDSGQTAQPRATSGPRLESDPSLASPPVDLKILAYFHHFTTSTSLTLPTLQCDSVSYWQVEAARTSLGFSWLVHGLLAVASHHTSWLSIDPSTHNDLLVDSMRFKTSFVDGFTALRASAKVSSDMATVKLAAQLICILRCSSLSINTPVLLGGVQGGTVQDLISQETTSLRGLMSVIQGCGDAALAIALVCADLPPVTGECPSTDDIWATVSAAFPRASTPPRLVPILRALPFRMAQVFGRPDGTRDVLTVFSAIDGLIDCCYLLDSVRNECAVAHWTSIVLWVKRVSTRFDEMLQEGSPAALVVAGYWSMLVTDAEPSCWFMNGLGARVFDAVKNQLPPDPPVHGLLQVVSNNVSNV